MEKNNPNVELKLNEEVRLKLRFDKCLVGKNAGGPYYLYGVTKDDGKDFSFFAPEDIHAQIVACGLKTGSEFILRKVAGHNGKKLTGELVFEAVPQNDKAKHSNGNDNRADNYKELMLQSLQDAVEIAKDVNGIDVQRIGMTVFIARTKSNGYER